MRSCLVCPLPVVSLEDVTSKLSYWWIGSYLSQLRCKADVKEALRSLVTSTLAAHRQTVKRTDVRPQHSSTANSCFVCWKSGSSTNSRAWLSIVSLLSRDVLSFNRR